MNQPTFGRRVPEINDQVCPLGSRLPPTTTIPVSARLPIRVMSAASSVSPPSPSSPSAADPPSVESLRELAITKQKQRTECLQKHRVVGTQLPPLPIAQFSYLPENRPINWPHVTSLAQSYTSSYIDADGHPCDVVMTPNDTSTTKAGLKAWFLGAWKDHKEDMANERWDWLLSKVKVCLSFFFVWAEERPFGFFCDLGRPRSQRNQIPFNHPRSRLTPPDWNRSNSGEASTAPRPSRDSTCTTISGRVASTSRVSPGQVAGDRRSL